MNPLAALQELENAVSQVHAPRDVHVRWMECTKIIGLALVERESLKVDDRQRRIVGEQVKADTDG